MTNLRQTDPFADESTTTTTEPPVTPPSSGDRSRYAEYAYFTNAMAQQDNAPTLAWVISQFGHYPSYEEWVAYDINHAGVWKELQSNPSYTDSNGSVYRWNPSGPSGQGGYIRVGDNPTAASTAPSTVPKPSNFQEGYTDAKGNVYQWNPYKGTYDVTGYSGTGDAGSTDNSASLAENQRQFDLNYGLNQRQFEADQTYRQQQQATEQQNYLSQLRANPTSWLEYSMAANQTPVVQPWMLPLSPKEYGLQAGQPIPGWQGTGGGQQTPPTPQPPVPGTAPVGGGTSTPMPAAPPQLSRTSNPAEQRTAIDQVIGMGNFPDPTVRDNLATTWQGNYQNAIAAPVVAPPPAPTYPQEQLPVPGAIDIPANTTLTGQGVPWYMYANGTGGPIPFDQTAIVGENGPELANLQAGSQITPLYNDSRMPPLNESTYPAMTPGTLPWLMTPSRQYQARLGPSSLSQYYGYEQMRTGAPVEDQQWRLWNTAPPSGQNTGFQYRR